MSQNDTRIQALNWIKTNAPSNAKIANGMKNINLTGAQDRYKTDDSYSEDNLIGIKKKPNSSQRELAKDLGFSIGKLNYCVKALQKKGLIKLDNFKNNPKKIGYAYILTPKGIAEKAMLSMNFIKKTMQEYDEISKEVANSLNFEEIKKEVDDAQNLN